jgi:YidC/Oxa1 family membrane protein insertase
MWDGILNGCSYFLNWLANLVGDWGLAIIIVTLAIRLILFPLQRKQYKTTFAMKEFQPKIQRIQELYAGDQQKIQEETMKVYRETGFNPLSGCLPLLIQMPIFIILFQCLRWKLYNFEGVSFYNILPVLTQTVPEAVKQATGNGTFAYCIPYILFAILFVACSVVPMIIQMKQNPQQKSQTMMMLVMMGIMFIWMAYISPAGVILYWSLSSAFAVCQQLITNKSLEKQKEEHEEEVSVKPIEVNVERRVKKQRQHKSH